MGFLSSHFKELQRLFFFVFYSWSNTLGSKKKKKPEGSLPALQMLDAPQTLETTVHHDGHAGAQCFTLLHTVEEQPTGLQDKWKAALIPDVWVASFAEKQHLKMGLFGITGVFQGIFVFSQSALKAKSLITDRFIFSTWFLPNLLFKMTFLHVHSDNLNGRQIWELERGNHL